MRGLVAGGGPLVATVVWAIAATAAIFVGLALGQPPSRTLTHDLIALSGLLAAPAIVILAAGINLWIQGGALLAAHWQGLIPVRWPGGLTWASRVNLLVFVLGVLSTLTALAFGYAVGLARSP